jgi:cytochrome c biogenesis protein CcmG/thiol:disulfide interchange protein DsbE
MKIVRLIMIVLMLGLGSQSIAAVAEAPNVILPALNGEVNLENLRGKVVYLDFWASWCKPCIKSFPWMHYLKTTYQDQGFEIIAINLDKEKRPAEDFLKLVDVNFIVAFDPEGKTAEAYQLRGMPSTYMIGRDGRLYVSHIGFREKDKPKMERAVKILLEGSE